MNTKRDVNIKYLKALNIFSFLAMILMNVLAEVLPLGGMTTGDISNTYQSLFTPTGFTFGIWFVIYVGLIYFIIWQTAFADDSIVQDIAASFALTCGFNIAWLVAWHFGSLLLSSSALLLLLLSLYLIDDTLRDSNRFVKAIFGIYLAWITMANIANLFILLGELIEGFAFSKWAICLAIFALAGAVLLTFRRIYDKHDIAYALTIVWAVFGVFWRNFQTFGFRIKSDAIAAAALVSMVVIIIMMIKKFVKVKTGVIRT